MEEIGNPKKVKMEVSTLDPMVFHLSFLHITEHIFERLDTKSLKNCKKVSKSWKNFIDKQQIVEKVRGNEDFQSACKNGDSKSVDMFLQNLAKYRIDLNSKDENGCTAFDLALKNRHVEIMFTLIQKSAENSIQLEIKDENGIMLPVIFHIA